eukprot:3205401-Prymnesium_polylepis.1
MLAAFDARRVVPVLIFVTLVCLPFLNSLPWSDGVSCCGVCGASVCGPSTVAACRSRPRPKAKPVDTVHSVARRLTT